MVGLGLSTAQMQVMRPELRQLLVALQAQESRFLEMSEAGTEAWLSHQLRNNPALRRRGPSPRGGEVSAGRAAPVDHDAIPVDFSWTQSPDLQQHLMDQLRLERTGDAERLAAEHIIYTLDDRGLLAVSLEEIAEAAGVDFEDAEDGQAVVMDLEPEGCGATDLHEYLVFKVRHLYREDRTFSKLVAEYLDEFRDKNYKRIAKLAKVTEEQVAEYGRKLADVPPFPAIGFSDGSKEHITPTVLVTRGPDGALMVDVEEPPRCRVELNRQYITDAESLPDGDDKQRALADIEAARHILGRMEHRTSLVFRIAEAAVRAQAAWFDQGDEHMKNLTMDTIADQLGEQRPNISRTVKGRYCLFEGRTFPLRDLFTHRSKPGRVSKLKLHALIRQIVDEEDKAQPLSDAAIARELLKRHGVREARRTVAKHRELAGVPAVNLRRKKPDVEDD